MLKKIKYLIEKHKEIRNHRVCYKFMDKYRFRVYIKSGICASPNPYGPHAEYCLTCPYFLDIRDNDDWS